MSARTLMFGLGLKVETYKAPANVQCLASLRVLFNCLPVRAPAQESIHFTILGNENTSAGRHDFTMSLFCPLTGNNHYYTVKEINWVIWFIRNRRKHTRTKNAPSWIKPNNENLWIYFHFWTHKKEKNSAYVENTAVHKICTFTSFNNETLDICFFHSTS